MNIDPNRCVVLVPVAQTIVPGCEAALTELERRGYAVRRVHGYAAIDQARNQMATDALRAGFHETMWIDSDIVFHPDAIDQLRALDLPISGGICVKKNERALAIHAMPECQEIIFGTGGGTLEVQYAGTGFLHVRREVYESIETQFDLPTCNEQFGSPMVPYFLPMIVNSDTKPWYLAEDYAFAERAKQCGYKIIVDSRIRLLHVGPYGYSWEDAGGSNQRHETYGFRLT